jgi:hypothetical protein
LPPGSTGSHRDSRSTQVSHASRHLHVTGRRFGLRSMSVLASALLRAASALPSRSVSPAPCFRALPVRRSPTGASRLLHSLLVCQDSSGFPARPAPTWGSRALPRPAPVEGAPTARFCPVRSVRSSLRSVLCALGSGLCALRCGVSEARESFFLALSSAFPLFVPPPREARWLGPSRPVACAQARRGCYALGFRLADERPNGRAPDLRGASDSGLLALSHVRGSRPVRATTGTKRDVATLIQGGL